MIKFNGKTKQVKEYTSCFKQIIKQIAIDHHHQVGSINYVIVSDEKILEINNDALKHDYYTDIITFDYSEGKTLEGEIYISIDRVIDNAHKYNEKFHVELSRVVFHGILHMVGYKDKTKKESEKMREMEKTYITQFLKKFHVEQ
jgi:probable rRNA maturation factor